MEKEILYQCRWIFAARLRQRSRRSLFLAGAVLAGVTNNATVADAQVRAPSSGEARLYARLMSMTDARSFERSLIDSALATSWSPLRAAAALAVGQIGTARGTAGAPLLRGLLGDRDVVVASRSAYALGLLHDSSSITALSSALKNGAAVARESAWALGEIGAPARDAIVRALESPVADEAVAIQLLLAASKLKPVPVAAVSRHLKMSASPSTQWAAAYAIARQRSPAGVSSLISLATDPEFLRRSETRAPALSVGSPAASTGPEAYLLPGAGAQRTRTEIARGLARQAAGDSLGDAALAVLIRLAGDTHPHVRINAIRSLGTYDVRAREAVVAATEDIDANVRITAAQSLGTVMDSSLASWTPLWQRDTSLMFRSSLLASAARSGVAMPELQGWMVHPDWHYRAAALGAAGSSTDRSVVLKAANRMILDTDGRVRAAAYGLLGSNDTAALAAPVKATLLRGLADADFYARATAIGVLATTAGAQDVPAVVESYRKALADSGNDARIAAIQYVARAWKRDSISFTPGVRQEVLSVPTSSDPLVRAAAESVSILSNWHSASGKSREFAWYQELVRDYVIPALGGRTQRATISTRRGDLVLELFGADAPLSVWNFLNLARTGYYRNTAFHRVVPNFVAQDGDPRDDGNGGPGYAIRDEMNPRRYERGALGMALSGPDTGGSQYFIAHSPQPHLDGHYTVFGRVLSGYDVLDKIVQGDRILSVTAQ
ncbi:MAG: peptidylprolyl isomerase [Gemmatimonadaceae bacterium]